MKPLSEAHIAFGREMRRCREAKSWSQEELSRQSGLHPSYVGQTERGMRNVSLTNILRIADTLGTPAEQLIAAAAAAQK